jgi:hypothetical protein
MPPKGATKKKAAVKAVVKKIVQQAKIKGHGDYKPNQFQRVKGKGDYEKTGKLLGNKIGGGFGAIGDGISSIFKIISGNGDYSQRAHLVNKIHKSDPSQIANMKSMNMGAMNVGFKEHDGNPRVTHREFIGTVLGSTAFATTVYRIQPGLRGAAVLFPWGSSVANCFEQYELNGMILEYKSRSSELSTAVTLGAVMMSTVYDAEASPLAGQLEIDNHTYTTSDVPCSTFIHPIECASKESPLVTRYVQASNAPSLNDDERFNDVGIFQVSTIGMPAAAQGVVVGELWATYDITFKKSALPDIHVGTTALMENPLALTGDLLQSAGGSALWDQSGSYPVYPLSNFQLQLPVGYAGTYFLEILCAKNVTATDLSNASWLSNGSDVTLIKTFCGLNSSNAGVVAANSRVQSGALVANSGTLSFVDQATTGVGNIFSMTFSTIAETLANNVIAFNVPTWSGGAVGLINLFITAVDNDIPSGVFLAAPPTGGVQVLNKRYVRKQLLDSAMHAADFQKILDMQVEQNRLMSIRLSTLESAAAGSGTSREPESEDEFGIDTPRPGTAPASSLSDSVVLGNALRKAFASVNASASVKSA